MPSFDDSLKMSPFVSSSRVELAHKLSHFLFSHPFKGAGFLAHVIPEFLVPTFRGPIRVRTVHGFDLVVDPSSDVGVQRPLYLRGTYEFGTLGVIRGCLRPGDTFLDLGSNIGLMTVFSSRLVGSEGGVYAFEPEPVLFRQLLENLALNRCENVHPFQLAIGSAPGKAPLYVNPVHRGGTSLVPPTQTEFTVIEVEVRTLDELVMTHRIPTVRMMKIDVEAWELEVLKGAHRFLGAKNAPILSIECSHVVPPKGGDATALHKMIKSVNEYCVFKLKRGSEVRSCLVPVRTKSELPHRDNLFCFLPTHLEQLPETMFDESIHAFR